MEEKKATSGPNRLFRRCNVQKSIILVLIIFIAAAMSGRKQFVLDPHDSLRDRPQIYITTTTDNILEHIHPLYSKENYVPPGMKFVPSSLLFSNWFHVFSVIALWALTIGGGVILIRMGGFTNYQSMAMVLFCLFIGSLAARELLSIPFMGPAPYIGFQHYNFRLPVIPFSILGLILIFKRRFLWGGILIGLTTFFHIKFGLRFFGLLFLSLLAWKLWGLQRVGLARDYVTWRHIVSFAVGWGILFLITYSQIMPSMDFFASLKLPRSQPLISPLAWLIKNESDDWLISYWFSTARPFFGFLFMAGAIGIFCEIIINFSTKNQWKIFAVVWEIATLGACMLWGLGFLFESYLIDWLPLKIAHSITLIRFWDLVWVVVIGFWITFIVATTVVSQKIAASFGKYESSAGMLAFHCAMVLFISINIAIFIKSKNAEVVAVDDFRSGKHSVLKIMEYVQICDHDTPKYNKIFWQALNSIKARNNEKFQEALIRLDTIYEGHRENLESLPFKNQDSAYLNLLNHFINNRYAESISETMRLRQAKEKTSYLRRPPHWSCLNSEPGAHHQSISIPKKDYIDATDWIKRNLPFDKGVIQPPYLSTKFDLFSQHAGFWSAKGEQHMMYMIDGYYGIGLHRLRSVAGPYAIDLEPGTINGMVGPRSREYFLNLAQEDLNNIRRDYPEYHYLLTENKNLVEYPVIYSNKSLTLYNISGL